MSTWKRYIKTIVWAICLINLYPLSVQAGMKYADETLVAQLGFFRPAIETSIRADSKTLGKGDVVDFEDDLGYKKYQDAYRLDGYWRFAPRHRLQFGHFDYDRDAIADIDREIQYGDTIFPVNTTLRSTNSISVTEIGYMYSILQNDNYELSAIGGIHWLTLDSQIKNTSGTLSQKANTEGPLPLFGLDFQYKVTPEINFNLRGQYFSVDIGDLDGSFTNIRTSFEYYFKENAGVGIGYNNFNLNVGVDGSELLGDLEWTYQGFQVFVTMRI